MSAIELKKKQIIDEIEHVEEEWILNAIGRLLAIDNETEVPEWHKEVVRSRVKEYKVNETELLNWNDVEKEL